MASRENSNDFDTSYFRYCRDHQGRMVSVDVARRNGRLVPRFSPEITEPCLNSLPDDEGGPDYRELVEELCQNLNDKERRRWLLAIRDGRNITEIAQAEGVSRPAVIESFHRASKKNTYIQIWLDHKRKRNQYE